MTASNFPVSWAGTGADIDEQAAPPADVSAGCRTPFLAGPDSTRPAAPDSADSVGPDLGASVAPDLTGLPPGWLNSIVHLQKLAAMGTMAAMLAHEFNNLLTRAINHADQALLYPDDRALGEQSLRRIMDNCSQAAEISQSIYDFAGKGDGEVSLSRRRRPVAVGHVVSQAIACLGRDPAKDNIAIRCCVPPDLAVQGSATLLQQVVYNLVLNARQAILSKARRSRTAEKITVSGQRDGDGRVVLRIADTGCGIQPQDLDKVFLPFYSTKSAESRTDRKGIGLGLAICRFIIAEHGGTIAAKSAVGAGTTFTLSLPGT